MKIHTIKNIVEREITVRDGTVKRNSEDYKRVFTPGEEKTVSENFYLFCHRRYKKVFSFKIEEVEDLIPRLKRMEKDIADLRKKVEDGVRKQIEVKPKRAYTKKTDGKLDGKVNIIEEEGV